MTAISFTALASGTSTANSTSYASVASCTLTAGRVYIVACCMRGIASDVATTISGFSGTWAVVDHIFDSTNAINSQMYVWVSLGFVPGTNTFTFTNADSATSMVASVVEVSGADTDLPVLTGSVKHSSATSASTLTLPSFNTFAKSQNRPFSAFYNWNGTAAQATPRTNWTEAHEVVASTDNVTLQTQYRSDAVDTAASVTWVGGPYQCGGTSFEVVAKDTTQFLPFF